MRKLVSKIIYVLACTAGMVGTAAVGVWIFIQPRPLFVTLMAGIAVAGLVYVKAAVSTRR